MPLGEVLNDSGTCTLPRPLNNAHGHRHLIPGWAEKPRHPPLDWMAKTSPSPRGSGTCELTPKSLGHTYVHMPKSGMAGKAAQASGSTTAHSGVSAMCLFCGSPAGPGGECAGHREELVSGALVPSTAEMTPTASGWALGLRAEGKQGLECAAGQGREQPSRAAWTMQPFSKQPFEIEQE